MKEPQIAIGKKTALKNLFNIVTTTDSDKHLKHFLKRHYLDFDDSFFNLIEEKRKALLEKIVNEMKPEEQQNIEIIENSYTTTYTYIVAAVEKIFLKYNIPIMTKALSYTSKIAKRSRDNIKEDLLKEFESTFIELDDLIEKIVPDPTDPDEIEKVLQNVVGH